jgi:hypothetical protein
MPKKRYDRAPDDKPRNQVGGVQAATIFGLTGLSLAAFAVDRLRGWAHVRIQSDWPVIEQFTQHAGNLVVGLAVGIGVAKAAEKIEKRAGVGLTTAQRLIGVGALGLAVGAGVNAVSDTETGMHYIGKYVYRCEHSDPRDDGLYCTVDPGDLIWGTTGTVAFALALTEWRKEEVPEHLPPSADTKGADGPPPKP